MNRSRRTCSNSPPTSSRPRRDTSIPAKFEDQYEDALKELLQRKQSGAKIEHAKEREPANVINLMDALRRSVQGERQTPAAARPKQACGATEKGRKRIEGQREMLLPIEGKRTAREPAKKTKPSRAAGAVETRPTGRKRSSR